MAIRRYKKISELDALASASLSTYVAGVDNGETVKITLDILADGVRNTINTLDVQRLNALEVASASLNAATSSYETKGRSIVSSSAQITALGFISSSQMVDTSSFVATSSFESFSSSVHSEILAATNEQSFNGLISGSSQLTSSYDERYVLSGSITQTTWDNIANKPTDIVSSSAQITAYGFVSGSYETTGRNILSGSILDLLPNGVVSGSEQVLGGSGVYSSSAQIDGFETTGRGILSGSVSYNDLTNIPNGIISSSAQLENATITNLTITNLTTINETASVIYSSGSNQLGDQLSDTQILSGSVQIVGGLTINGIQVSTQSFVDLSSLNTFTSSANTSITNLNNATSSYELKGSGIVSSSTQITSFGFVSGSYETTGRGIISSSADLVTTSSFNTYTASISTASLVTSIDTLNTFTASQSTASLVNRLNTIESVSGSWITESETGSFLTNLNGAISGSSQLTASYDTRYELQGREIISSSNQIAGLGYATTSSLNSFTASYITDSSSLDSRLDVLEAYSSSQLVPTASVSNRTLQTDVYVKNSSGAQINKGKVVRIVGAVGDNPLIVTASFLTEGQSANTLGITTENIANDSFGWVITEGVLLGVNTTGMNAGQLLFLGENGSFTTAFPVAPNHGVRLGEVLREQQNNGSIYVRIDNGSELGEAHDVVDTTTTSSYGDILMKSGSLWINNSTFSSSVDSRLDNQEAFSSSLSVIANSSTKILNRVSYTGGSSWEGTYSGNGGRVLVQATLTGFVSSVALYEAYLKRNGVTVDTTKLFFNATSQHTTFPTLYYVGENETGSNTYSVVVGAGVNLDANDFASIVVTETYNFLNPGLISSSAQITEFGFVSGSYETTGRGIISSSTQLPSGIISGSSQLTSSFDTRYTLSGSVVSGGASVTTSDTAPSSPSEGDLWWKTNDGNLYVYYDGYWVISTDTIAALPNGVVSGSSQLTSSFDGRYTLSGSILATPAWTSAGAITIGATTTAPTKGTRTQDNISYRQLGSKEWEVVMTYYQTANTGAANGSGDYLFTLPNSLSFDTSVPSQQLYTANVGTSSWYNLTYVIPSGGGGISNGVTGGRVYPVVYNSTQFRILTINDNAWVKWWGSGHFQIGDSSYVTIQLTFRFTST